jgi:hypothetical protein
MLGMMLGLMLGFELGLWLEWGLGLGSGSELGVGFNALFRIVCGSHSLPNSHLLRGSLPVCRYTVCEYSRLVLLLLLLLLLL